MAGESFFPISHRCRLVAQYQRSLKSSLGQSDLDMPRSEEQNQLALRFLSKLDIFRDPWLRNLIELQEKEIQAVPKNNDRFIDNILAEQASGHW